MRGTRVLVRSIYPLSDCIYNCGEICQFTWQAGKKRGAWQKHKRLPYSSINLYRTSLDHLLLGMDADIDELSTAPIIKPFLRISHTEFGRGDT
jgi:hypothetical protein